MFVLCAFSNAESPRSILEGTLHRTGELSSKKGGFPGSENAQMAIQSTHARRFRAQKVSPVTEGVKSHHCERLTFVKVWKKAQNAEREIAIFAANLPQNGVRGKISQQHKFGTFSAG